MTCACSFSEKHGCSNFGGLVAGNSPVSKSSIRIAIYYCFLLLRSTFQHLGYDLDVIHGRVYAMNEEAALNTSFHLF